MSNWETVNTAEWDEEPLDPEVFELCDALNRAGFVTYVSCSGHGHTRPCVWFEHSDDKRIEDMARFVLSATNHDFPPYSLRIRKQIYVDAGDYSWSIEIAPSDVYKDTPEDVYLRMAAAAMDAVAQLINDWYRGERCTSDEECCDCMNLDLNMETKKFICDAGFSFAKSGKRCPGYDWNEVNDKPYYEKSKNAV